MTILDGPDENSVPRSTCLTIPFFLHLCSYSYQVRFKVKKGIYLTILDEAYVSKIAVLRETHWQDCNPAQIGSFFILFILDAHVYKMNFNFLVLLL